MTCEASFQKKRKEEDVTRGNSTSRPPSTPADTASNGNGKIEGYTIRRKMKRVPNDGKRRSS